jgi:thioredoxin reductase
VEVIAMTDPKDDRIAVAGDGGAADRLAGRYDVVVIGGGAAGLNGALMLARSRRSVAVIDAGAPRNAPAEGVHGLLARDGTPPAELLERGRAEVRSYGGHVAHGEVVNVSRSAVAPATADGFEVALADGRRVHARRLLVTIGLVDELPEVAGVRERWGRDVVHCPYCHGWEVRDRVIGVLGSGPMAAHQAHLFRQLSDKVTLFAHTMPPLDDEQREQLAARGIRVVGGTVAGLEIADDRITGVRLADGHVVEVEAVAVAPRATLRAGFLGEIGLRPRPHPSGMGEHLPADPAGRAEVPGVWLAGNVTDPSAQVGAAAAAGALAGAQINYDLVQEETRAAVEARAAAAFSAAEEARVSALAVPAERRGGLG